MLRVFRAAPAGQCSVVYDPCSGALRLAPCVIPAGRCWLDDAVVRAWLAVHPAAAGRDVPVSLCWSPLVRCNLDCPHCLDDKSVEELSAIRRAEAARLIGASGVLGVDISGGEPLLLRDLPGLARSLAGDGCAVSVTTNGWHLARRAEELAGRADAVRVSLDGPDPARHDALRGAGSFGRALAGIRACQAAGIPVQVQSVLMTSTAEHALALAETAAGVGATGVTFLQLLPVGVAAAMPPGEMLSDQAAAELLTEIRARVPLDIRLRLRAEAEGFTVVRADGRIWRNGPGALAMRPGPSLAVPGDLALDSPDGSA